MFGTWDILSVAVQARLTTIIWGDPGIGKTEKINQMGEKFGCHVETVLASLREPSDFGGLPVVASDDTVKLAPPGWAKTILSKEKSILFLDEISTAPPAVQASLLRVAAEGVVGDTQLPKKTAIVAAANPPESASGGWDLSPPMANRFIHLYDSPSNEEWYNWMMGMGGSERHLQIKVPENWEERLPSWRSTIVSFVRTFPFKMHNMPKSERQRSGPWPSPRSWDLAAKLLAAADSAGLISVEDFSTSKIDFVVPAVSACVGEGIAVEFAQWLSKLDVENPEEVLRRSGTWTPPEKPDVFYATMNSVFSYVDRNMSESAWRNLHRVVGSVVDSKHADFLIPLLKQFEMIRKNHNLEPLREFFSDKFWGYITGYKEFEAATEGRN